jgi:hypothetical protein
MSFNISDYIEVTDTTPGDSMDQFANGRTFMRLLRSSQFNEITDYIHRVRRSKQNPWLNHASIVLLTELWKGLSLTPRVSASSRLVVMFLSKFFQSILSHKSEIVISTIFKAILTRFGNMYLFKDEISSLFIGFITKIISQQIMTSHKDDIVTAILSRFILNPADELVVNLIFLIGTIPTKSDGQLPLFVRCLVWILKTLVGEETCGLGRFDDIIYISNGHLVKPPSDSHPLLDALETSLPISSTIQSCPQLACVCVTSLTKISSRFPQFRPRIISVLSSIARKSPGVLHERINESLLLLNAHHLSKRLLVEDKPFQGA